MKIRKIKIHNVKGISEYCVDALLLPNMPHIELDSFDDQCSIILGFMLWPGF